MTPRDSVSAPVAQATPDRDTADTPRIVKESSNEPPQTNVCCSGDLIFPSCFPQASRPAILRLLVDIDLVLQQQLLDEVSENHRLNPTKTIPLRLLRYLAAAAREGRFTPELCFQAAARRKTALATKAEEKSASTPVSREQIAERLAALRKTVGLAKQGEKS